MNNKEIMKNLNVYQVPYNLGVHIIAHHAYHDNYQGIGNMPVNIQYTVMHAMHIVEIEKLPASA